MNSLFYKISIVFTIPCMVLCGCKNDTGDKVVAKVKNKQLYLSDIVGILPESTTKNDSISLTRLYIDKWIETQLLLQKAELNLSNAQLDISKEIETYRTSLLIYKYEEQLLQEKLDTVVYESEMESYYKENSSNFITNDYLVKVLFLKIPIDAPNINKVRRWYVSTQEKDINELTQYCYKYAAKHDSFDNEWIPWSLIAKELPQPGEPEKLFSRKNIEQSDKQFYYFVSLRDTKVPGDIAPLSLIQDKVKNIIINKRKLKFISELEKNIYNDALAKKQFEIYNIK